MSAWLSWATLGWAGLWPVVSVANQVTIPGVLLLMPLVQGIALLL